MARSSVKVSECPETVAALDLSRPAILEASAGTGKTYAIEHLVLRLLTESDSLELPNILVLTYTDKATGELKDKLRARLAWRIARGGLPPSILQRLKDAHLNFDRASIFTIHGFCQRVLRKYAFETNVLFQNELVKDVTDIMAEILAEDMRSEWLSESGSGQAGLEKFRAKIQALGMGGKNWDRKLIRIARDFNPLRGDKLLPEFDPAAIASVQTEMDDGFHVIAGLFPGLNTIPADQHPALLEFKAIKFSNRTIKTKGPQLIHAALECAALAGFHPISNPSALHISTAGEEKPNGPADRFLKSLREIHLTAVDKTGFACLMPTPSECATAPKWLQPLLEILESVRILAERREILEAAGAFREQCRVIEELRAQTREHLRKEGLITYDGMIEHVCLALRADSARIQMLRREFRFCLVDEFQDTDPLQWEIFRSVFLESRGSNPLYLIGDPKQAIYRFRGGDIHTYMQARKDLYALSREGKAQGLGLDVNFRSSESMIEAYNAVFTQPPWFHKSAISDGDVTWKLPDAPDPLGYVAVHYGGLPIQKARFPDGGAAPVVLKDFTSPADTGAANKPDNRITVQKRVHAWIIKEIFDLMRPELRPQLPSKATDAFRDLDWGDICVLVRKGTEKNHLENAMIEAGIPVQVNRRMGLYQADTAGHYLALLEALENPRDAGKYARGLLTAFFRPPGDLHVDIPSTPPPQLETWLGWAQAGKWQKLFHALRFDSGLFYRLSLEEDGDRRIMDFDQVAENLVLEALAKNLDLSGLVDRLRELRQSGTAEDEEADMHREESEGGKVSLMTMHVSKGLEFPVVFLASFSGNPPADYFTYRDGLHTVYHLDKQNAAAKSAYLQEAEGEDRRLYYVAFTRARYRLYAPLLPKSSGRTQYGPLGGFVAESLRMAASTQPSLFAWRSSEIDAEEPIINYLNSGLSSDANEAVVPTVLSNLGVFDNFPAASRRSDAYGEFLRRRKRLASYSHLVRQVHAVASDEVSGRFDKEESPVAIDPEDVEDDLPRGKEIGNMLHEILEQLDFSLAAESGTPAEFAASPVVSKMVRARMQAHQVGEAHGDTVTTLLWNTLRSVLPDIAGGPSFRLAEISALRPEMEFLFPYPSEPLAGKRKPQDADGYLWGFIDLVFRHSGRYYLLDWKSNWLSAYGPEELQRSMTECHYDLQYKLYALALDKWLTSLIPDYRFENHFGGIYYLYLRGLRADAPEDGSKIPGVFAIRPTRQQMEIDFPASLEAAMGTPVFSPAARAPAEPTSGKAEVSKPQQDVGA